MAQSQLEAISTYGWWVDDGFAQDLQSISTFGWFFILTDLVDNRENILFILNITRDVLMTCRART